MSKPRKEKIIEFTIRLPMDFSEDWDDDMIEFHLNESSWCMDNIIDELKRYSEANGCICNICEGRALNKEKDNGIE